MRQAASGIRMYISYDFSVNLVYLCLRQAMQHNFGFKLLPQVKSRTINFILFT